jgi:siroheme synthase-like protein
MQHFPIFVDLHVVLPLIIGDAPALVAKLRLLSKAAPLVDVIASKKAQWRAEFATDTCVCWLAEMDRQAATAAIKGRPLVILDCEDEPLNRFLVVTIWAYGVPVNVPDNRALSGFYLGAIVDRALVIIGISTSGLAPVLGQALRARLETSAAVPTDLQAPRVIAIQFGAFSDGRGFTHARQLRMDYHSSGPIIATGNVIADQIDYLRRCGFTMPRSNRRTTRIGNRRIRRSAIISSICRTARGRGATSQPRGPQFCHHRNGKFFHKFFGASLDKLFAKAQIARKAFWHSQVKSARCC